LPCGKEISNVFGEPLFVLLLSVLFDYAAAKGEAVAGL
jgi:hypothetical protein